MGDHQDGRPVKAGRGYVKIHRSIRDHWTFPRDRPWTPFEAWFDLICSAAFKPSTIQDRGELLTIEVGQILTSTLSLADRWGWSRGRVRRFLDELEMDRSVNQSRDNRRTIVTVLKFNKWQGKEASDDTDTVQQIVQQTVQQTDTSKNLKKGKKGKNPSTHYPPEFEIAWKELPKEARVGKPTAARSWRTQKPELNAFLAGLDRWRQSDRWARGFIPNAATFINQRRWEDDPEPVKQPKSKGAKLIDDFLKHKEAQNGNGSGSPHGTGNPQRGLPKPADK